jgi:hypothetical protein
MLESRKNLYLTRNAGVNSLREKNFGVGEVEVLEEV